MPTNRRPHNRTVLIACHPQLVLCARAFISDMIYRKNGKRRVGHGIQIYSNSSGCIVNRDHRTVKMRRPVNEIRAIWYLCACDVKSARASAGSSGGESFSGDRSDQMQSNAAFADDFQTERLLYVLKNSRRIIKSCVLGPFASQSHISTQCELLDFRISALMFLAVADSSGCGGACSRGLVYL